MAAMENDKKCNEPTDMWKWLNKNDAFEKAKDGTMKGKLGNVLDNLGFDSASTFQDCGNLGKDRLRELLLKKLDESDSGLIGKFLTAIDGATATVVVVDREQVQSRSIVVQYPGGTKSIQVPLDSKSDHEDIQAKICKSIGFENVIFYNANDEELIFNASFRALKENETIYARVRKDVNVAISPNSTYFQEKDKYVRPRGNQKFGYYARFFLSPCIVVGSLGSISYKFTLLTGMVLCTYLYVAAKRGEYISVVSNSLSIIQVISAKCCCKPSTGNGEKAQSLQSWQLDVLTARKPELYLNLSLNAFGLKILSEKWFCFCLLLLPFSVSLVGNEVQFSVGYDYVAFILSYILFVIVYYIAGPSCCPCRCQQYAMSETEMKFQDAKTTQKSVQLIEKE